MSVDRVPIVIIGAGAVGLAIAYTLSCKGYEVCVIEKNDAFGRETSSRNSEVIHAGLYYPNESLKSTLCIEGLRLLYAFCDAHAIAYARCGKLVVGVDDDEVEKIAAIYHNASLCGVRDLRWLTATEIAEMEPSISVKEAFYSPSTGYFDTHAYMKVLYDQSRLLGADYVFSTEVIGIEKGNGGYDVSTIDVAGEEYTVNTEIVINAAGLWADQVAGLSGIDVAAQGYTLHWSKGAYFRLNNPARFSVRHLVYPSPTETSLGIHLTPDLGGGVRLGPDAQYCDDLDYSIDPTAAECFFESVRRYVPALTIDDIVPDTVGIRPKVQAPGDGVKDFVIREESVVGFPGLINLVGIESPGLTASLSIAERVSSLLA